MTFHELYGTLKASDIGQRLNRTESAITQRARIEGLRSQGRYSLVDGYFRVIDTTTKAYLLGLLAADGYVSHKGQVTLAMRDYDVELLELLRAKLAPTARLKPYLLKTGNFMVSVKVQSAELVADLAQWDVVPAKSLTMRWPDSLSADMQRSFLHGYFDGDGSLSTRPMNRWSLTSGNPVFLESVQRFVLASCGVKVGGPYRDKRHAHAWSIVATGAPVRVLNDWLHSDGLGLARKRL